MIWNHPVETTIKNWLFGVPGGDYQSFDLHGVVTKNAGVFPEIWCTTATLVETSEMPPVVASFRGNPTGGKDVWFWSGGPQTLWWFRIEHLLLLQLETNHFSLSKLRMIYRLEDSRWVQVFDASWYMQWLEPEPQSNSHWVGLRLMCSKDRSLEPRAEFLQNVHGHLTVIFKNCLWNQGRTSWFYLILIKGGR